MRSVKDRISSLLQKQEAPQAENKEDAAIILEKLEKLKNALIEVDTDTMDELVFDLSAGRMIEFMDEVSQNILLFDYDKAINRIDDYIRTSIQNCMR